MSNDKDFEFHALDYSALTPGQRSRIIRAAMDRARQQRAEALRHMLHRARGALHGFATAGGRLARRITSAALARAVAGFRLYRAWRERRRAATALWAMSDADLKDIGTTRGEIEFLVRRDGDDPTRRPRGARRSLGLRLVHDRGKPRPAPAAERRAGYSFSSLKLARKPCAG